ncbi:Putative protein [Zobellia galactanivorans]|uniref:Uncharacterized protein n=1 Tax=Zobellia galactanivorans (strain DSM 12802 / CCUG 47099 / CIP 106680 / NCIMB 13871 / Dsij) TaxID=63186 RepID=G0L8N8_ZOBGA|nr:Putative protein [Zobellia galactanivorans]
MLKIQFMKGEGSLNRKVGFFEGKYFFVLTG